MIIEVEIFYSSRKPIKTELCVDSICKNGFDRVNSAGVKVVLCCGQWTSMHLKMLWGFSHSWPYRPESGKATSSSKQNKAEKNIQKSC